MCIRWFRISKSQNLLLWRALDASNRTPHYVLFWDLHICPTLAVLSGGQFQGIMVVKNGVIKLLLQKESGICLSGYRGESVNWKTAFLPQNNKYIIWTDCVNAEEAHCALQFFSGVWVLWCETFAKTRSLKVSSFQSKNQLLKLQENYFCSVRWSVLASQSDTLKMGPKEFKSHTVLQLKEIKRSKGAK